MILAKFIKTLSIIQVSGYKNLKKNNLEVLGKIIYIYLT
jgi:hypothetical protein